MRLIAEPRASAVAVLRDAVVDEAGRHLARPMVDDVALVVSELVTNAVEHGSGAAGTIVVDVARSDDRLVVTVANETAGVHPPPPGSWTISGPDARRGRGLGIVARLAPDVEMRSSSDRVEIATGWPIT